MNKKAFTLVELIVVITILAVLATVAFISFQWYALSARDSTRLADLNSITKVLELYNVKHWKYPNPDAQTNITYSWSTAWTQWIFGTSSYSDWSSMSNVPVDPVTGLEYPYSVTSLRQEYQLAAVLENPVSSKLSQSTFAWTQEAQVHVKWNYNGKFLKVRKNTSTYLLWVPSILASDITSVELETILANERLVYKGYKNLPASYSWSVYNTNPTDGFAFWTWSYVANDLVLFMWDTNDLEIDSTKRVDFLDKLQTSYSGSVIESESDIAELLSVDSSSSSAASNYVATALNNSLKTEIAVVEVVKEQTLEDIKILIEEVSALVYSESVIAWVETEAAAVISWLGEDLNVSYGYPIVTSSSNLVAYWNRLITLNDKFTYISDSSWTLIIYEIALADMVFTTGTCAVTFYKSSWIGQLPTITLFPCL
jgi:prepilin-type N-terminal cleavage/methylation domain-containing protein